MQRLILSVIIILLIPGTFASQDNINISTDAMDGIIDDGEYAFALVLDAGKNFVFYYTVNSTVARMALQADISGYLAIGFGSTMLGSDFIIGYVNSTHADVRDAYGDTSTSIKLDDSNDVIEFAGIENNGKTTLEFTRLIDTSDSTEDAVLTLNSEIGIIWAYHTTSDDFSSYHSSRGYSSVNLQTNPLASSPLNLTASVDQTTVHLNWEVPTTTGGQNVTGYNVYHTVTTGESYQLLNTITAMNYTHNDPTVGARNYYIVAAVTTNGVGYNSTEVVALVSTPIKPPTNFQIQPGDHWVALLWDDEVNEDVNYLVYRGFSHDGSFYFIANITTLGFIDTTTEAGRTYFYYIISQSSMGESEPTQILSATPFSVNTKPQPEPASYYTLPMLALGISLLATLFMWIVVHRINRR